MDCSILFHPVSRQCLHSKNACFYEGTLVNWRIVGNLNGMSTMPAMSIKYLAFITPSSSRHGWLVR
jgi:hypothetical protein